MEAGCRKSTAVIGQLRQLSRGDNWNIQEEEEEFVTKRNRPFSKSSRPTLLTGFDDDHEDDNEDEEDDDAHEDEEEDEDDDEDVEESREGFYNPREFEGLQVERALSKYFLTFFVNVFETSTIWGSLRDSK
jgi:hypothetical protein